MARTRRLHLVSERVMPKTSVSWNASVPMRGVRTWPVMQTRGTESILASAMPVTGLVAPGPLVAMATPTLPVTRAEPSAAKTAPCSCRVRMWRTPLPASASYKGMIAPPGYPKTRSAPSARKQRKTISAPLSMDRLGSRSIRGFVFFLLRRQPRHHAAQPRADFFDGMFLFHVAEDGEVASALLVFVDPFASEGAVLDAGENLFHGSARRIANHAITAGQIAILGRVGNRVTHPAQPAF